MTGIHRLSMFDVVLQGIPPRPRRTPSSSSVDDRQMDGRFGVNTDDRLDGDIDDPVDVDVDERVSLAKPVRASAARTTDAKSGIVIELPADSPISVFFRCSRFSFKGSNPCRRT